MQAFRWRGAERRAGRVSRVAFICVLAAAALALCSRLDTRQRIGGRVFEVPAANLISERIPWLPPIRDGSFIYYANPGARLEDRNIVSVGDQHDLCSRGPNPPSPRGRTLQTCGVDPLALFEIDELQGLVKSPGVEGVYSVYRSKSGRALVSCTVASDATGEGRGGLCSALMAYRNLTCEIGFSERDLARLPLIARQVEEQLTRWERDNRRWR